MTSFQHEYHVADQVAVILSDNRTGNLLFGNASALHGLSYHSISA